MKNVRLNKEQKQEILTQHSNKVDADTLAKQYGITKQRIYSIVSNSKKKNVNPKVIESPAEKVKRSVTHDEERIASYGNEIIRLRNENSALRSMLIESQLQTYNLIQQIQLNGNQGK